MLHSADTLGGGSPDIGRKLIPVLCWGNARHLPPCATVSWQGISLELDLVKQCAIDSTGGVHINCKPAGL